MYDYCRNINKTRTRLKQCIQNVFQWIFFSCVMLQPETIIIQIHLTFQMDLYIISYYLIGECCSSQSEKLFPFCKLPPVLHRGEASLQRAALMDSTGNLSHLNTGSLELSQRSSFLVIFLTWAILHYLPSLVGRPVLPNFVLLIIMEDTVFENIFSAENNV